MNSATGYGDEFAMGMLEGGVAFDDEGIDEHMCRGCGCTDSQGCPGGCIWATEDLCSRCARAGIE